MADLVVYGVPASPFVRKVETVLTEKSLEYELEIVNIMPIPDWYAQISPARRIPVLRDRTVGTEGVPGTIPDSSAICTYLEKLAPLPNIYPSDSFEHGRAVWLEEYADSELAGTVGMGIFRPIMFPIFQKQASDLTTAKKTWVEKIPRQLDYLEATLDGQTYFVGNQLSIADIAIACQTSQLDLITTCLPDQRWKGVSDHLEAMKKSLKGFENNLAACAKIFSRMLPEKIDLG